MSVRCWSTKERATHQCSFAKTTVWYACWRNSSRSQEIYNLDYLYQYRIKVEPYRAWEYFQCYRCQRLGHSHQTCHLDPICVKCAEPHLTSRCTKKTRLQPAKCANCGKYHPKNYKDCITCQNLKTSREANRYKTNERQTTSSILKAAAFHYRNQSELICNDYSTF